MEEIEAMLARALVEAQKKKKVKLLQEGSVHIQDQKETTLELLLIKAREGDRASCETLLKRLLALFFSDSTHHELYTARIQVVQVQTKDNAWDGDLLKLVFRNISEELLGEKGISVLVTREKMGSYFLVAATKRTPLEADWKRAMEGLTSFVNSHMDLQIAVFPDQGPTRIYDSQYLKKPQGNTPGIYWKQAPAEDPDGMAARIHRVQAYIKENVGRSLTRTEVAQYVHLNEDYFTRCFKKYTGFTFKEYDLLVRMETAKTLLEQTRLPVSMIASKVGFDNFSHFSQTFRRYAGKTPTEYR